MPILPCKRHVGVVQEMSNRKQTHHILRKTILSRESAITSTSVTKIHYIKQSTGSKSNKSAWNKHYLNVIEVLCIGCRSLTLTKTIITTLILRYGRHCLACEAGKGSSCEDNRGKGQPEEQRGKGERGSWPN